MAPSNITIRKIEAPTGECRHISIFERAHGQYLTEANVTDATEILCSVMQDGMLRCCRNKDTTLTYRAPFTDPLCYASTGGDLTRLPMLIHPMIAQIAFRLGDMYGAFDENGTLVGFQAWVPPGKALFATYVSIELSI